MKAADRVLAHILRRYKAIVPWGPDEPRTTTIIGLVHEIEALTREEAMILLCPPKEPGIGILEWVYRIGGFTRREMMVCNNNAFVWSCLNGHLEIAQWLDGKCQFTRKEILDGNSPAFRMSCMHGHLEVAQWLDRKYRFTREEMMVENNLAYRWACMGGWLDVVQWLHGRCNFTREEMIDCNWVFHVLSQHSRTPQGKWMDVVHWLDGICKFTREELTGGNKVQFRVACRNGHLKVAQWFDGKCQFTREELTDACNRHNDLPTSISEWLTAICASR